MAYGAGRVRPMLLQLLTERGGESDFGFVQLGYAVRRRGRGRSQDILQQPLAAKHRRGARRVRGNGQDTRLCQHAAPLLAVELNAAEEVSSNSFHPVVPRQPLVQERVGRIEKLQNASVLTDDGLEKHLRFKPHRRPQRLVKIREAVRVRGDGFKIPQLEPLPGEVLDQRPRLRVPEHPPNLLFKNFRIP